MKVIAHGTLRDFVNKRVEPALQAVAREHLQTWLVRTEYAHWTSSADLKKTFAAASIITAERVVFNIRGNNYRLIASVSYQAGLVLIKWIGTHKEYDRIDAAKVEYDKSRYTSN